MMSVRFNPTVAVRFASGLRIEGDLCQEQKETVAKEFATKYMQVHAAYAAKNLVPSTQVLLNQETYMVVGRTDCAVVSVLQEMKKKYKQTRPLLLALEQTLLSFVRNLSGVGE